MSDTYTNDILEAMKCPHYNPRRSKELARSLGIPKSEYRDFRNHLKAMAREGQVVRGKGGRWSLPKEKKTIAGTISITRAGNGFLLPDAPDVEDLYIAEQDLGPALNGDKVLVTVEEVSGHGLRRYARVVKVTERATPRIVAFVTPEGVARPEDPKNPFDYRIELEGEDAVPPVDHKILLEVTRWPGEGGDPSGRIVEVLGPAGEPDTETAAILAHYMAPGPFPDEVKAEVRNLRRNLTEEEEASRLDLTDLLTFTIDPVDARDFDDALSYQERDDGVIVIGVHIADVSHFVKPGSDLDREAQDRSTSIYLPGRVIPMLPEELSNDLCSLRPEEDHLTKTVFLHFDKDGNRLKYEIHRSIIHSKKRFAYEEVYALLTQPEAAEAFEDKEILKAVQGLHRVAQQLRERRLSKGGLELNMPEFRVVIGDDGYAEDIVHVEHDSSHQLVEDFMLAANVALAEWCEFNGMPVLYRAHAAPSEENVEELAEFLTASGYPFKAPLERHRLSKVIEDVHGKPEEHAINLAILKSFMQAVYSHDPVTGHFALNFTDYMHFTSPIRRYPDLQLHQQLDSVFSEGAHKLPRKLRKHPNRAGQALEKLGLHTSGMERKAMKIEEAVKDFRRLELLSRHEQREFKAVVTGVRKFGIFVEIENYFVEGMIPRRMLEAKGFSTREEIPRQMKKAKRRHANRIKPGFHLGQQIMVRITEIDLPNRICEMEFLGLCEG